jgi:hypothetical protein
MIRILNIRGSSPQARRERLQRVQDWMARRGWRLADYAEEAGSAMFERDPAAAPLGPLDPTRWLPGPEPWKPREWWATLRAEPRLAALPAAVLAVAAIGLVSALAPSLPAPWEQAAREQQGDWRVVIADQLNVREGPSTTAQVVAVLYRDQRVLVEGAVDAEWVRVGVPERGYVSAGYLRKAEAPPEQ